MTADCDFIPAGYHQQQTLRRAIKVRVACVGTMLVIMALWVVAHQHQISKVNAMLSEVSLQKDQLKIHSQRKKGMETERAHLRDRWVLIDRLRQKASLVVVFGELSRRMPETVILVELEVQRPLLSDYFPTDPSEKANADPRMRRVEEPEPQEAPLNGMRLCGLAASLPDAIQFAAALERSKLFENVNMEMQEPTVWAGRRAQKFEVTCELLGHDEGAS